MFLKLFKRFKFDNVRVRIGHPYVKVLLENKERRQKLLQELRHHKPRIRWVGSLHKNMRRVLLSLKGTKSHSPPFFLHFQGVALNLIKIMSFQTGRYASVRSRSLSLRSAIFLCEVSYD